MSSEATQAIVEHHLQCFGANDLDGLMTDYTEETLFLTPDGPVRGLAGIREIYAGFFQIFPAGNMELDMKQLTCDGDYAYFLWEGSGPEHIAPLGTDTLHIQDGKIAMQSFAAVLNPR